MMRDAILNFAKQFEYDPVIENAVNLKPANKFVVCGMGGSHLAADLIKTLKPSLRILTHSDYSLPDADWMNTLLIISAYSGNTEEPLDAFAEGLAKHLPMAVVTVGGKLLEIAKQNSIPYIKLPNTGIQPRSALGFSTKALLKLMSENGLQKQASKLSKILKPENSEPAGKELAQKLSGKIPVIYSSAANNSLAYNWKIKLNETGKIPAFYNIFPELNHNEMTGFDVKERSKQLSKKIHFIFLRDSADHSKIQKRMEVTASLYRARGLPVEILELTGEDKMQRMFSCLILADWFALYTAEQYDFESEQVPMVEEFKKLIA